MSLVTFYASSVSHLPGLPVFDMMLIGVGDDGHVGSLYPSRAEVGDSVGPSAV